MVISLINGSLNKWGVGKQQLKLKDLKRSLIRSINDASNWCQIGVFALESIDNKASQEEKPRDQNVFS